MKVEEIEAAALHLDAHERGRLAALLIESLEEGEPEIEQLWLDEAERRLDELLSGNERGKSLDHVLRDARRLIE